MRRLLIMLVFVTALDAATTGRGGYPIKSQWVTSGAKTSRGRASSLRKWTMTATNDQALKTVMEDWFFTPAPAPPASGTITRTLMGVGK